MIKHLTVLLVTIMSSLSAVAQFGTPPYDFQTSAWTFFESGTWNDGETLYWEESCENYYGDIYFNESFEFEVFDEWGNLWGSGIQNYTLSMPNGFYTFKLLDGTVLFTISHQPIPMSYYSELEIALGQEEIQDSLITLCEKSPFSQEFTVKNPYGGYCYLWDMDNSIEVYHNGQYYPGYNFSMSQLKDGDSLYFAMIDNFGGGTGIWECSCVSPDGGYLKSKTYYVKTTPNPISTVLVPDDQICPGDSITLNGTLPNSEYNSWRGKLIGTTYFGHYSNKSEYDIIKPGEYYLIEKDPQEECYTYSDTFEIEIDPSCTHGYVTAVLFDDLDADGIRDYNETRLRDQFVTVSPSGENLVTDAGGRFGSLVPLNTVTSFQMKENDTYANDSILEVEFTNPSEWNYLDTYLPTWAEERDDIEVLFTINRLRPGFEANASLTIRNLGNSTVSVSPKILLDTNLTYVKTTSGRSLYYNGTEHYQSTFNIGARSSYNSRFVFKLPADIGLLGQTLTSKAWVVREDDDTTNNVGVMNNFVTGSYDPNDKSLFEAIGSTESVFISDSTVMEYTIRFQNTGTDTAFNVRVEDVISNKLDVFSIEVMDASHEYTMKLKDDNKLVWYFDNILLPDSNVNEPQSHGYIKFRINQKKDNPNGTIIANSADIYFDFNPAVVTNEIVAMVGEEFITSVDPEFSELQVTVSPNPTVDYVTVECELDNMSYQLVSESGRVIRTGTLHGSDQINLENEKNGIYYLLVTGNQKTVTQRIVKQ
jgi:hypothetical protein